MRLWLHWSWRRRRLSVRPLGLSSKRLKQFLLMWVMVLLVWFFSQEREVCFIEAVKEKKIVIVIIALIILISIKIKYFSATHPQDGMEKASEKETRNKLKYIIFHSPETPYMP